MDMFRARNPGTELFIRREAETYALQRADHARSQTKSVLTRPLSYSRKAADEIA